LDQWLNGLSEALVRIHAVEADDFQWTYFTYNDISSLENAIVVVLSEVVEYCL
jgi:hypothetical protein